MEATGQPVLASPTEPPGAPGGGAPDWASVRDLHCPLCGYNLRGLVKPRCPECGYRFRWAELLDEKLTVHPYLFEHHPERNTWSFLKTLVGGLRPARFWKVLHPGQAVHPGRLTTYWLLVAVPTVVAGAAAPLVVGTVLSNASLAASWRSLMFFIPGQGWYHPRDGTIIATPPPPPSHFSGHGWDVMWKEAGEDYVAAAAAVCAWPWVTLLTLMIFRASMRRAKVRAAHVRRCVVYCADAFLWAALLVLALNALAMFVWMSGGPAGMDHWWSASALLGAWGVAAYRLGRAYERYLRFDHPLATVIASQVIVGLLALVVLLNFALNRIIHEWRLL